jgi:hypothetical protein
VYGGRVDGTADQSGGDAYLALHSQADGAALDDSPIRWGSNLEYESVSGLTSDGTTLYAIVGMSPGRVLMRAVDLGGTLLWETEMPQEMGTWTARSAVVDPLDGNVVMAASHSTGPEQGSVELVRFSAADGSILDRDSWSGAGIDVAHDIVLGSEYGAIVGRTGSAGLGGDEAFVMRFRHTPDFTMPPGLR